MALEPDKRRKTANSTAIPVNWVRDVKLGALFMMTATARVFNPGFAAIRRNPWVESSRRVAAAEPQKRSLQQNQWVVLDGEGGRLPLFVHRFQFRPQLLVPLRLNCCV